MPFYLWSTGFSLPCSQSHYDYILVLMERNKTKTAKEFIDWRITHIHTYVTENTKVREWLQLHLNPPSIQRRTIVCCRCKIPEKPWTFTVSFLNAMLALLLMTWGNVKTQHRPACIIRAFRATMGLNYSLVICHVYTGLGGCHVSFVSICTTEMWFKLLQKCLRAERMG